MDQFEELNAHRHNIIFTKPMDVSAAVQFPARPPVAATYADFSVTFLVFFRLRAAKQHS